MPKTGNMSNGKWPEVFLWFNLGFCALVSQVVFQRECINTFSGNELSIGLVLFVWLLFGGIGSVTMGKAANRLGPAGRSRLRLWLLISNMPQSMHISGENDFNLKLCFPAIATNACQLFLNPLDQPNHLIERAPNVVFSQSTM